MVGLMLKDFYESFCIKKNLIGFICSILLYGMVFFLMPSEYIVILLVVLTIPMTSVSPLQYSIEQDELSKFDQMLLTSLPVVLLAIYGYHIISLQEGLLVLSISVIFTLIMLPINNAGFLTFGNKKGTILYVVTLVAFVIGFITLVTFNKMGYRHH